MKSIAIIVALLLAVLILCILFFVCFSIGHAMGSKAMQKVFKADMKLLVSKMPIGMKMAYLDALIEAQQERKANQLAHKMNDESLADISEALKVHQAQKES